MSFVLNWSWIYTTVRFLCCCEFWLSTFFIKSNCHKISTEKSGCRQLVPVTRSCTIRYYRQSERGKNTIDLTFDSFSLIKTEFGDEKLMCCWYKRNTDILLRPKQAVTTFFGRRMISHKDLHIYCNTVIVLVTWVIFKIFVHAAIICQHTVFSSWSITRILSTETMHACKRNTKKKIDY